MRQLTKTIQSPRKSQAQNAQNAVTMNLRNQKKRLEKLERVLQPRGLRQRQRLRLELRL